MQTSFRNITGYMILLFSTWSALLSNASAESDMKLQEKALMAREKSHMKKMDHSAHPNMEDQTGGFHGVFYGYLPCKLKGCDGLKMTLSLKNRNNYLLVTQYAKQSSREYYDKGKYNWDKNSRQLTLTSKKDKSVRLFAIRDESALVQLTGDGLPMPGDQDDYTLLRSDKAKSRAVHIH